VNRIEIKIQDILYTRLVGSLLQNWRCLCSIPIVSIQWIIISTMTQNLQYSQLPKRPRGYIKNTQENRQYPILTTLANIYRIIRTAWIPRFKANIYQPQNKIIIELALSLDGTLEKDVSDHASSRSWGVTVCLLPMHATSLPGHTKFFPRCFTVISSVKIVCKFKGHVPCYRTDNQCDPCIIQ
jgi:hypothetical protein